MKEIYASPQYEVIKRGQGLVTRMFALKTTSEKALEKMISEAKDAIETPITSLKVSLKLP